MGDVRYPTQKYIVFTVRDTRYTRLSEPVSHGQPWMPLPVALDALSMFMPSIACIYYLLLRALHNHEDAIG